MSFKPMDYIVYENKVYTVALIDGELMLRELYIVNNSIVRGELHEFTEDIRNNCKTISRNTAWVLMKNLGENFIEQEKQEKEVMEMPNETDEDFIRKTKTSNKNKK